MPNKPRPENRHRMVRVEDDLWQAAKECAGQGGTTVSAVIRGGLREFVARLRPTGGATPTNEEAAISAVLHVMGGRLVREDRHVPSWPEDERDLHSHFGSFDERADAVSRLLAAKIVRAVLQQGC